MRLHDCQMAPNPRRARIFLAEKGLDVEKVEHSILDGETNGEAYLKINPWGTVPALELDDGSLIREAPAIFRYIEASHPSPNLLGDNPREAAEIEAWERFSEIQGGSAIGEYFRNQTEALTLGFTRRSIHSLEKPNTWARIVIASQTSPLNAQ